MPRPDDFTAALPSQHLPAELLRRYVAGELSPAQEHAVEAHTLECEQCAEVLEGLEMQPAAVTDASLAELRQRLHTRVAELSDETPAGPTALPTWWRPLVAAAMLLLLLGTVAWLALRPTSRPEVAAHLPETAEKTRGDMAPAASTTEPATDMATASGPEVAAERLPARPPRPALATVPATKSVARTKPTRATAVTAAPEVTDLAGSPNTAAVSAAASATTAPADTAARASYAAIRNKPAADQLAASTRTAEQSEKARAFRATASVAGQGRTVQGRIVDMAGQPLPGATVLVPGTSMGVSTNTDGKFALTVPPGNRQLAVSSIGYTTQTRFLQPTDSTLTLALAPDTKQLSEVVIVRREAPPGLPSLGPLPAGGYPAFRQYLHDSLNYPEKARDRKQEGTVRLQFVVGTDGRLSDIKVVRRLSPECDAEAIRLLKEGPLWVPGAQNGRRTARKVEINVPFSLEK